ncbi:MAG TPA: PAS domain S-box protein [Rubricoccaceae bacterium]|jgi:PAS domain S-box-containing protein
MAEPARSALLLDWFVPDTLAADGPGAAADAPGLRRRARIVAAVSGLSVATITAMAVPLSISGTPAQVVQAVMAVGLCVAALGLLRRGHVEPAAWLATLTLTATPVAQAALDVGIRDPVLALIIIAPMVAAMASGLRLAIVSAVLGIAGAGALLTLHVLGLAPEPISSPDAVAWYAFAVPGLGAILSAGAGALYVRHTGSAIDRAETEAVQLGSALRASEERYRSLVDSLPIGMYRTAPDGRVLLANLAMAHMIGAESVDAALDLNAAALYADPAEWTAFQNAILKTGFVRRYETEWRTPGGRLRQVRIDARVTLSPDGQPLYYEGAAEDITAERRARAALAHSEARFRALVQHSSDLVVVLAHDARLTYVSPAAVRLLGVEAERLVGRDALSLVHPDDRDTARASLARMSRSSAGSSTVPEGAPESRTELRLRHADGHFVYAEGVGTALYHDPAVGGLVLNLRDVTDRKRAQAVLVQAKRQAEEVAHLKSTFLANMSHEIRTPLTAILGFSDILSDEITDPQQQEFVELISRSGRRLMDTLNSVLDLARLEAGRGDLACVPMRVGAAAEEAATLMGPAAAERGLTITARVAAPDALAALDDAAFARVLHNLVGNALKFTETGGVTIHVDEDAGHVVVRVVDTGIGIDEAFLPRLFGEFEQESTGVERTHEGAGLGLAISRQLVERMEGTIAVESAKGVGTTFTLTFPRLGAEAPAPPDRPHVLVVDDNEQARLVATRVLDAAYTVTEAVSGADALAAARRARPDVVLLDINLGEAASGEDVLREIRADVRLAGLPVVAVTAFGMAGDRARFLGLGFDDYVTKPYTRDRLLAAVAAGIAGPRPPVAVEQTAVQAA